MDPGVGNEQHNSALKQLCRVCGNKYNPRKTGKIKQYQCSENKAALKTAFGIDVTQDKSTIHPPTYCHPCRNITYFKQKAIKEGTEYNPTRRVFN